MSSPNPNHASSQSQIPTPIRSISRNNSNISVASSSNRGELNSTLSTATTSNSIASSYKSHLSKTNATKTNATTSPSTTSIQNVDQKQLLAACGSSTPIRSFQRATISSVVKTRAFDNSPMLQSLLAASTPVGQHQNSVSNSQTPSPHSTPVFSRSRSLRMSGGPGRYQQSSPSYLYRNSSRTPDLYSFNNSRDSQLMNCSNCELPSTVKLAELTNEKLELKESLEFLECERQVLMDSTHELKETLHNERSQWKKELEDTKKQLADATATRIKAESQLVQKDVEIDELKSRLNKVKNELDTRDRDLSILRKSKEKLEEENAELSQINDQLKLMMSEKLRYNGLQPGDNAQNSKCISIVTEMARLRLEVNAKDRLIDQLDKEKQQDDKIINNGQSLTSHSRELDILNKFLDETVECIKGWPEDLANSEHVQNLMKTLLLAYR